MPEELGRIEKPSAEEYKTGRKLFFVPLVFSGKELPVEFLGKYNRYWEQVEEQITNLEAKLGPANKLFHELIAGSDEESLNDLKRLNETSYQIIQKRILKGALLELIEDNDILAEVMDWSRCLSMGLQSHSVLTKVYEFYTETNKKRNEYIGKKLNESLKENETGILIMAEGHQIQFASDIRVFYVAPPALDEIKRWLRDFEAKAREHQTEDSRVSGQPPENPPGT